MQKISETEFPVPTGNSEYVATGIDFESQPCAFEQRYGGLFYRSRVPDMNHNPYHAIMSPALGRVSSVAVSTAVHIVAFPLGEEEPFVSRKARGILQTAFLLPSPPLPPSVTSLEPGAICI